MASSVWKPSGVVTLTTDFGLDDPYVGMMKGVILSRFRSATVVDVTHGVPPQDVRAGAFFLGAAHKYFPPGTVHVAVVDPGVGSARRILVARTEDHCFLAPDNGLLPAAIGEAAIKEVQYGELDVSRFALEGASHTFHGRDVFAPVAASIASGSSPESVAARVVDDPVRLDVAHARRSADGRRIDADVLVVDHFGNIVLALCGSELEDGLEGGIEAWCVVHRGKRIPFGRTYALVDPGQTLALVDSYGAVEIAVRDGDAARQLGLAPGDHVTLERRS